MYVLTLRFPGFYSYATPPGLEKLPGCNPVQPGPNRATPVTNCGAPTEMLPTSAVSFLKKVEGWQPVGCAAEANGQNLLTGGTSTDGSMTIEKCLNNCATKGFKFAGLKNKNTCSCGNSFDTSKVSSNYACNLPCAGDASEFCGASNRLAVYNGGAPVSVPAPEPGPSTTANTSPGPTGGTIPKYGQCGGQGVRSLHDS